MPLKGEWCCHNNGLDINHKQIPLIRLLTFGAHALKARVTVVVLCVCLSGHILLAVHAIKSIMIDTIVLSVRFAAI